MQRNPGVTQTEKGDRDRDRPSLFLCLYLSSLDDGIVESPFATVRLRTTAAKRFKKVENATALIWKILQVAESTFRRLKGAELLPLVDAGAQCVGGVLKTSGGRR